MAKEKIKCDMCGKDFDDIDKDFKFGVHCRIGYGSQYDGDKVDLDYARSALTNLYIS